MVNQQRAQKSTFINTRIRRRMGEMLMEIELIARKKKSQHKIDNVNSNRKCIVKLLCVHSTLEIQ